MIRKNKKKNANQHTFRLVAIRVGANNKQEIIRALKTDTTYFFYNDYVDSYDENYRWNGIKKSETSKPIDPKFFSEVENNYPSPIINVSAIVGKNGDGKSSLIEFLLRLVNNYAVSHGYNKYQETLQFIPGVDGIVYFEVDGDLFHICCDKEENYPQQENETCSKQEEEHLELFYSIVMNYSLYAYNSHDLDKELGENGGSWIDGLFHKNDSYQTPIVINPMRTEGNIDVNREHELSVDRLKLELINTNDRKLLDSKEAVRMDFTKKNSNAVLDKTINPFFEKVIDFKAPSLDSMFLDINKCIELLEGQTEYVETNYSESFQFWIMYCDLFDKYKRFFKVANGRAIFYRKANKDKMGQDKQQITDWNRFLVNFTEFVEIFYEDDNKEVVLKAIGKAKDLTKDMNSLQFQRVIEVIEVARLWSQKMGMPSMVDDLTGKSDRKNAIQYLVYKTISIFHKYRPYLNIIGGEWLYADESNNSGYFCLFENNNIFSALSRCFEQLFETGNPKQIKKSYETLKLRQTYNYLVYNTFEYKEKVTFDELGKQLKKKSKDVDDELIALLPPPIYKASIMFKDTSIGGHVFPFAQLSSGEQQLILSMTGSLYHLRNLNYRTTDNNKQFYGNVNVILEEVELYFHPDFQRKYIKYLLKRIQMAKLINIHAINIIVVTHSPFVLSDIPKNNVLFLQEGRPVRPMQDETFGANIHNMLKNGFFLEGGTLGDFAKWKINECFDQLHHNHYGEDLKELIGMVGEPLIRSQLTQLYAMNRELYKTTDLEKKVKELESIIHELESNIRNQLTQLYAMNRELYKTTDLEMKVKELESIIHKLQSNNK